MPIDHEGDLDRLRIAARRGAATVTRALQVIEDAAIAVIERWELRVVDGDQLGGCIDNLEAWAYRCGANAARSLGAKLAKTKSMQPVEEHSDAEPEPTVLGRSELCTRLAEADLAESLTRRQAEVVRLLSVPGATIRGVARTLQTDHSNVRRVFERALARLKSCPGNDPPPPHVHVRSRSMERPTEQHHNPEGESA